MAQVVEADAGQARARLVDLARKVDQGLASDEALLATSLAAIERVYRLGWEQGAAPLEMLMQRACAELAAEEAPAAA